jgi:hypothetical protein
MVDDVPLEGIHICPESCGQHATLPELLSEPLGSHAAEPEKRARHSARVSNS